MSNLEPCTYFLKGHCKLKSFCQQNHNIQSCSRGKSCKLKTCQLRHVMLCPLNPKCYFPTCSYQHPTFHPLLPPLLPAFNMTMSSRVHSLEVLVRKLTTEVSDLSDELVAVKNEAHQTHLNDSPDKINTFLENAGAWNEKLDELFIDSQLQAQLVKDMADSYPDLKNIVEVNLAEALETNIQRDKDLNQEMEGLRTDISKITIFEQKFSNMELAQQKISDRVTKLVTSTNTNLNNITERINKLEVHKSMSLSETWPKI